jgi:hypothetical protein
MNLYIEIENGVTKNHPAFESNLIEAFGSIPQNWELFVRVERPIAGLYQVFNQPESIYTKIDGVWTDVWQLRDMTAEEKLAKQQAVKDRFNSREQIENWSAWIFNENTCGMEPLIQRPEPNQSKLDAGIFTYWCGFDNNWKDTPARPNDNNEYKFDFFAWQWVQVVN